MRGFVAAVAIATAGLTMTQVARPAADAPDSASAGQLERAFVPSGEITMSLSAGEYRITAAKDAGIHLRWSTKNPDDMRWTKVKADVTGKKARVETDGPSNGFRVDIELPSRSDVYIRLSAGDFEMNGIKGHKDISAWAGELRVGVGRAEDYRSVRASVTAGEIKADPFSVNKGGLFRSFNHSGRGAYDLRVRLTAGEVTLR